MSSQLVTRFRNFRTNRSINANLRRFATAIPPVAIDEVRRQRQASSLSTVEVVIPCFNDAHLLSEAFESALNQDCSDPLIITMVDDASEDGSLALMSELSTKAREGRRVRILANTVNMNQAASMNRAIESSEAEVVVALDSDDVLAGHCVRTMLEILRSNDRLFMVGATSIPFVGHLDADSQAIHEDPSPSLTVYGPGDAKNFRHLNDLNMTQSSCTFLRSAWQLVGGYRERRDRVCSFADRDFQMRVCSLVNVGVLEDTPLAWWRTDSGKGRDFD